MRLESLSVVRSGNSRSWTQVLYYLTLERSTTHLPSSFLAPTRTHTLCKSQPSSRRHLCQTGYRIDTDQHRTAQTRTKSVAGSKVKSNSRPDNLTRLHPQTQICLPKTKKFGRYIKCSTALPPPQNCISSCLRHRALPRLPRPTSLGYPQSCRPAAARAPPSTSKSTRIGKRGIPPRRLPMGIHTRLLPQLVVARSR